MKLLRIGWVPFILLLTACPWGEGEELPDNDMDDPTNDLNFDLALDGIKYTFLDGVINDKGNYNPFDDRWNSFDEGDLSTHYSYGFTIADDELEIIKGGEGDGVWTQIHSENAKIFVYADLYALNEDSFQPGTFEFTNIEGLEKEDVKEIFFFPSAGIYIFEDPEGAFLGVEYSAISGTVIVVENSSINYTLTFDLTVKKHHQTTYELIDGTEQNISFSYTGDFDIK
ncbi:hypothetical protein SAMN04489724_2392 [Algoriphagus locisalis]|uniref:Uncharacterized protein n=1 Tax=Algoriphagus locisalis TaxID=305507 RepID=A0A1I7BG56_9BACT|nr:hypothetical protein [Algoriphagus locisalis]SFT86112.1 hypothetical protein SAMN04489724_2392 [Algoriphagus locisalis]